MGRERWVVERTFAWLHNFRRLRIRWEVDPICTSRSPTSAVWSLLTPACVKIARVSDSNLVRPYRGITADDRVANRREALLDAALDVFADGGWAALSARRVCEQASLTRRYFYESFDNLDALIGAAWDRITGEVTEVVRAAVFERTEAPLPELVARAVSAGLDVVASPPAKGRFLGAAQGAGSIATHRAQSIDDLAAIVAAVLATHPDGGPIGSREARIAATTTVGAMLSIIDSWLADELDLSKEEVVFWCTTAAIGVIGAITAQRR
jgi:AcrR family transcriptional regulator